MRWKRDAVDMGCGGHGMKPKWGKLCIGQVEHEMLWTCGKQELE